MADFPVPPSLHTRSLLHIGTAGWSYKDWIGPFYSQQQSRDYDWLEFYSQYFNCVEVNSTYYTYVSPSTARGWVGKVSDKNDFVFTIKLHQDFTHKRKFTDENIKAFTKNLEILAKANRLGGILIQFPYSFAFSNAAAEYLQKLSEIFQDYNKFVEVRHKSWNNPDVYKFFNELDLTFCTIDQPQIGEALPFEPIVTNGRAYIRFHGRNKEAWLHSIRSFGKEKTLDDPDEAYKQQSLRYDYLYSMGELVEISQKIKEVFDKVKEVFIIMNNHPQGKGVANAFELMHLLNERMKVKIPETMLKAYPRLNSIVEN
ncbi:MAG: DUF72 domain-containing protein [Ignavibacteria bacterium]|nr:DUF72 domain-containing protein [Ignavibacteria bacterium]